MTDLRRILDDLAAQLDRQVESFDRSSPVGLALAHWVAGPRTAQCAHVYRRPLIARVTGPEVVCVLCAGRRWLNADFVTSLRHCDTCTRRIDEPNMILSPIPPYLVISAVCNDCRPKEK